MKAIYLASSTPFVGKNVVSVGLAHHLTRAGRKVGYFKPFGPFPIEYEGAEADADAVFFKRNLGLDDRVEDICPVVITSETQADMLRGADLNAKERVMSAFERVCAGKDVVLCVGLGGLCTGQAAGFCTLDFVEAVDADVLMIDRYRYTFESLDGILCAHGMFGDRLKGVIYNRVKESLLSEVENAARPFIESRGIRVLGALPDDPVIGALPVREIGTALDARILCGSAGLDELIEGFTIGAMNVEAAVRYFRRCNRRAVITGGDRVDVQLAAIEARVNCLILTGDLYPNERIITRAEESGTPLLLVSHDTATTIRICEDLSQRMSLNSERKLDRIREMCDKYIDFQRFIEALGLED